MQTEIFFSIGKTPTVTLKKLEAIEGSGTAYITDKASKRPNSQQYIEVATFDELKQAAESGKDVVYKTATYSGRARFYISK